MERVQFISQHNPLWAVQILEFCETHPEFKPYLKFASITKRPVGFGKNPGEPRPPPETPKTVLEFLKYHVCGAGVRRDYGQALWRKIKGKTPEQIQSDPSITEKKKSILVPLSKLKSDLKIQQVDSIDIKGVGIGAKKFAKSMFTEYDDYIDATDSAFRIGVAMVYGLEKRASPKQIREITQNWTKNAAVGTMICNQIYSYVYEVNKDCYKNL
jgi:hypothetical protein